MLNIQTLNNTDQMNEFESQDLENEAPDFDTAWSKFMNEQQQQQLHMQQHDQELVQDVHELQVNPDQGYASPQLSSNNLLNPQESSAFTRFLDTLLLEPSSPQSSTRIDEELQKLSSLMETRASDTPHTNANMPGVKKAETPRLQDGYPAFTPVDSHTPDQPDLKRKVYGQPHAKHQHHQTLQNNFGNTNVQRRTSMMGPNSRIRGVSLPVNPVNNGYLSAQRNMPNRSYSNGSMGMYNQMMSGGHAHPHSPHNSYGRRYDTGFSNQVSGPMPHNMSNHHPSMLNYSSSANSSSAGTTSTSSSATSGSSNSQNYRYGGYPDNMYQQAYSSYYDTDPQLHMNGHSVHQNPHQLAQQQVQQYAQAAHENRHPQHAQHPQQQQHHHHHHDPHHPQHGPQQGQHSQQLDPAMDPQLESPEFHDPKPGSKRKASAVESQTRLNHVNSEKRRRAVIKDLFNRMCDLVPAVKSATESLPKSAVLQYSHDHMIALAEANDRLRQRLEECGVWANSIEKVKLETPTSSSPLESSSEMNIMPSQVKFQATVP